ncbi:DUF3370 domain-containing protein [Phormidium sp. CLA17]|uniref:DUF3370 domain-containing protein n=1 Tax=Leptolyngbya sp. Cla-17 TaxID=2803751 RepID=UPI0014922309|nr:DUF3370 domain-containing protein [Leptolyngbya sp. Cla-17]MBM0743509.1 DUF3370 domain-containing protein [Leptolyngbya sp. Cla-17]
MLSFLSAVVFAQATPAPVSNEVKVLQTVRVLPGKLDSVLVFNSNSPELVQTEGILLSTFPPTGKRTPAAHLNVRLQGRFDVFAHHIAKAKAPDDLRTLYLGVLLHNPGGKPVTVDVLQAASYLSQPDAPFIDLPAYVDNPLGTVFAGPGSRAMVDILRGKRPEGFPAQIVIPPRQSRMLLNLPIPVKELQPPINGRSTLMRLSSNAPVYAASLALFAPTDATGTERAPTIAEWQAVVESGKLAEPRDKTPTPPDQTTGQIIYGRVAGVAKGSRWIAQVVDPPGIQLNNPATWSLTIPPAGQAFSYGLSTLLRGTLGTGQNQTARMVARYPDTAYQAHGNYAIEYNLTLPLQNLTNQTQTVAIMLETPIKEDQPKDGNLRFFEPLPRQVFFRGTVRLRYTDDRRLPQTRYVHLVQRRGQQGEPLAVMTMKPGDRRLVQFDFLYPPDSTPPQILTVKTLKE